MEPLWGRFWLRGVCSALLASCVLVTLMMAQGMDTALLRGTVLDASGAVVPGAKVTITNQGTRVAEETTTDQTGQYIFNALKPAVYSIKVETAGFKTLIQDNIVLRVGQQSDLDLKLELGNITETVEVPSTAPLLNTVSGALGTEVSNRYITELPLEGRDLTGLSYLAPGVTEVTGDSISTLGGTNFVSNGQRNATAEFRMDGALISHPEGGEGATTIVNYLPSPEAVQEFKLQNNSFSAEYGSNGVTVVDFVTKSGTNQFHGSGWYFFRRPALDANDFFSNLSGTGIGAYQHDQFGASLGGPIKRQKTFFFVDFEKTRDNSPNVITTSVPSVLQRQGDFSHTFNPDGSLQQIFNPFSVSCVTNPDGSQNCNRASFPGNVIPKSMFDAIGAKLLNLYPLPNQPGDPVTGINNYSTKLINTNPAYQMDVRIDHNFSDTSRIVGRYSLQRVTNNTPDPFLAPQIAKYNTNQATLEHTWTPTPTSIWTNRMSFTRWYNPQDVLPTVDPLTVGFPQSLILNPAMT